MEDFVTYEQAEKLCDLGFDYKCIACYDEEDFEITSAYSNYNSDQYRYNLISAPTLAQVQKWFREKYKLWLEPVICIHNIDYYSCDIYDLKTADEYNYMDGPTTDIEGTFNTPEKALSAGIDKVIQNLKEQNNGN